MALPYCEFPELLGLVNQLDETVGIPLFSKLHDGIYLPDSDDKRQLDTRSDGVLIVRIENKWRGIKYWQGTFTKICFELRDEYGNDGWYVRPSKARFLHVIYGELLGRMPKFVVTIDFKNLKLIYPPATCREPDEYGYPSGYRKYGFSGEPWCYRAFGFSIRLSRLCEEGFARYYTISEDLSSTLCG